MTGSRSTSRVRAAGLAAAAVAALLLLAGPERIGRPVFDAWQTIKARDLRETPVEVVFIDPPSVAAVGRWPWPRYHLARLTERIAAGGPRAIGLDILFAEPDPLSPALFADAYHELPAQAAAAVRALQPFDVQFGAVIGMHPVVLPRAGMSEPAAAPATLAVEAEFAEPLPESVARYEGVATSIAELDDVAVGHGLINGAPDGDGIVRRLPLAALAAGQPTPGFALELARVALGVEQVVPVARGERLQAIRLGDRTVPTDADGGFRLRFGDFPADHVTSAVDILRRGFRAGRFKDKIVLVGLASEGTQDVVATPRAAETFGILVQAQGVDAILRGGWLSRPWWAAAAEWVAGGLLAAIVMLAAAGRGRAAGIAGAIIAASILAGGWFAFDLGGLLLSPLPPLAIGGAAAAGAYVMSFAETRRERERLRASLLSEQLSAAETTGELQAAREIQLGMLPPRARLAELDPRIEIDAMLEPARSVGGDFYDALRLGRHVIGFVIGDVTGKGVSAALFMAVSRTLSRSAILREEGDLASAAAMLDRELSRDGNPQMGVTMLMGYVDLKTGAATFLNAGHDNPLLVDADGNVSDLEMEGGPPFCVVDDYPYPAERIRLEPGEALVLYTDGISEARNAAGELFGRRRLIAAAEGGGSARALSDRILAAVRAFVGEADAADDLTLLVLRYLGSGD